MNVASVYGVTKEGDIKHIAFGAVAKMTQIWKSREPEKFVKIGLIATNKSRIRNVAVQSNT